MVAMPIAIVVCRDLMTTSRFVATGVEVVRCASEEDAIAAARNWPLAPLFIDLQGFPLLPARIRSGLDHQGAVYAFAPHVQVDLIAAARPACTEVLPRGAVIRRFASLVSG